MYRLDRTLCVAPMMAWTDRHCRYFHRLLSPSTLLYTEMVTTGAVFYGDREKLLGFDPAEHPLALQLGGSDPEELAAAARIAREAGFDEINLNVGCPSDRVRKGRFGACLMKEPDRVRDALAAMAAAVDLPVTVKTRIGVDDLDSDEFLQAFVARVAESGIRTVILHARKAWLSGLSPKQNRELPELHYGRVFRVAAAFPGLEIILNGGIRSVRDARDALDKVDGVMVGRAAYQNPWVLAELEAALGSGRPPDDRRAVVKAMAAYASAHLAAGGRLHQVARHMLGLFHGQPGARAWRRQLSECMHDPAAGPDLLIKACPEVPEPASAGV